MLPFTAGARPGKINMMSLPNSDNSRLLPERKPSPTPTSSSRDPTPQAIPNMVRNERSLCAQRLRKICAKMSRTVRIIEIHCTFWTVAGLTPRIESAVGVEAISLTTLFPKEVANREPTATAALLILALHRLRLRRREGFRWLARVPSGGGGGGGGGGG